MGPQIQGSWPSLGVKGVGPEPWTQEVKLHVRGGGAAMKMRASLVQALCKHRASYVQANAICVQATLWRIADILCFRYFSALKPPPKYPYYNIK